MDFEAAVALLTSPIIEGGYSKNPADPGGETMWGITAKVARRNGYHGEMKDLPLATAKEIYRREYWDVNSTDTLPTVLRYPLFDATVNSGAAQAAKWLQRALGLGDSGRITTLEIEVAAKLLDAYPVACQMIAERLEFLTTLPTWGQFGKGWARRVATVLETIATERDQT